MPVVFTKNELYRGGPATVDITDNIDFELRNNAGNIYFSILGQNDTLLFDTATFTSLVNCKVVSGSRNAAFAVTGHATASFTLNIGGATIAKENIKFRATNTLSSSPGASGNTTSSFFGIDLTYS
jgi:hypothetical protein